MRFRAPLTATLALIAMLCAGSAGAVLPSEMLKDPALEARARTLSEELRCMVCQNQSIDDSDAPLAADIRVLLRERIVAGDSDDQVRDFLVARYGEFVLLKPRFNAHTLILWLAAPGVLLAGGLVAWWGYRSRRRHPGVTPLDAGEQEALRRLLSRGGEESRNITES
jgi:cytochrome c-type biogenesis protein CcmH